MVLSLECSSDVVMARIESDSGGDRNGRVDDSREDVVRKLNLFRERTMPLLDHYRAKGVRIVPLCVEVATQPSHLAGKIPPDPLEGPSEREGTH
jgi:adenylate kinase family enzyme